MFLRFVTERERIRLPRAITSPAGNVVSTIDCRRTRSYSPIRHGPPVVKTQRFAAPIVGAVWSVLGWRRCGANERTITIRESRRRRLSVAILRHAAGGMLERPGFTSSGRTGGFMGFARLQRALFWRQSLPGLYMAIKVR